MLELESFLSAVTCEFLNGSLTTPVEAGLVQAAQVATDGETMLSGHVRGLVSYNKWISTNII